MMVQREVASLHVNEGHVHHPLWARLMRLYIHRSLFPRLSNAGYLSTTTSCCKKEILWGTALEFGFNVDCSNTP